MDFNVLNFRGTLYSSFSYKDKKYAATEYDGILKIYSVGSSIDKDDACEETKELIREREIGSYNSTKDFREELNNFIISLDEITSVEFEKVFIAEITYCYDINYRFYSGKRNVVYSKRKNVYDRQEIYIDRLDKYITVEKSSGVGSGRFSNVSSSLETTFVETDIDKLIDDIIEYRKETITSFEKDIKMEEKSINSRKEGIAKVKEEIDTLKNLKGNIDLVSNDLYIISFEKKRKN